MDMKKKKYTVLFEHDVGGLVEHLVPLVREWLRLGHDAVIAAPVGEMEAVRTGYRELESDRLRFVDSQNPSLDWSDISALVNDQPGAPGAVCRSTASRWDIPRITINHGLTDKKTTFPADILGNTVGLNNVLFASGPAMFCGSWEAYTEKWPEIVHSLKVVPIGSPKTDCLFDGTYCRAEVLGKLGLNVDRPTVLYAPTYQQEASLEIAGEAIILALAALPVNVLVRLHHFSLDQQNVLARQRGHHGRAWAAVMKAIEAERPNVRHVTGSSNPYFVAADVLIGDASGASFEFILQDKPVVFYDVPSFFERHGTDGVGYWGRDAGVIVRDLVELKGAVSEALAHPEKSGNARKRLIDKLVYYRGDAAQRAAQALLQLIEGDLDYPTWGPRTALWQERLLQCYLLERLAHCAREHGRVALFGAGLYTHRLLALMKRDGASLAMPNVVVILDDGDVVPSEIEGIPVSKPDPASSASMDAVLIASDYHQAAIRKRCHELFGPDFPVIDLFSAFPWHRPCVQLNKSVNEP